MIATMIAPSRRASCTLAIGASIKSAWRKDTWGGLVPGGVVLIGGDPGIGKSTLLLQALALLSGHLKALYVSGEESAEQVALRASRRQHDAHGLQ